MCTRRRRVNNPILALSKNISLALHMPMQNRVTPEGDIQARAERGLFMGNRGILHDRGQRLGVARWRHPHWIICVLAFKGWHREIMQPNAYTELFFLDEATALAAGHRPCALCRRTAYLAFHDALKTAVRSDRRLDADSLDRMLHAARIETGSRRQRRFEIGADDLPDGAMFRHSNRAKPEKPHEMTDDTWLVQGRHALRWRPGGYDRAVRRPTRIAVQVLTPRPTVLALQQGYRPTLHPSAEALAGENDDG